MKAIDEIDEVVPTIRSKRIPGIKKSVNGVPSSKEKPKLAFSAPVIRRIAPITDVIATKIEIILESISKTESYNISSLVIVLKLNSPEKKFNIFN